MKQWYKKLFENFGNSYNKEPYTKGTNGEVNFIEKEIKFNKAIKILDIGCGTGRHSIELAKRGYLVTGIDLSASMLKNARQTAQELGLKIKFTQADARRLNLDKEFDLVIMICEGAFPLMETDEMNYLILKNAAKSLKDNGKFIFTTLNGLFPLYHPKQYLIKMDAHKTIPGKNVFNLVTFRVISDYETTDDSGKQIKLHCNERYYIPSEITWFLQTLKFKNIEIFGCELGKWNRQKKLTTEDFEMLVIAEK